MAKIMSATKNLTSVWASKLM